MPGTLWAWGPGAVGASGRPRQGPRRLGPRGAAGCPRRRFLGLGYHRSEGPRCLARSSIGRDDVRGHGEAKVALVH